MAAINTTNKVMKAWYEMLHNNISVPVYRVDAPASEEGHYVLLRVESETDNSNNAKFVTNPVVITEVVTKFKVAIKDGLAADIDSEIASLLYPSVGQLGLPRQVDIQITEAIRQNATYIPEDDGTFRYHRLVTRNRHRVVQTASNGLGPEHIINGGFVGNDSDWLSDGTWFYDINKMSFNWLAGQIGRLWQQAGGLTEDALYRLSFNITGNMGFVTAIIGTMGTNSHQSFNAGSGDVSFDARWEDGDKVTFLGGLGFNGSITNVSLKEIL